MIDSIENKTLVWFDGLHSGDLWFIQDGDMMSIKSDPIQGFVSVLKSEGFKLATDELCVSKQIKTCTGYKNGLKELISISIDSLGLFHEHPSYMVISEDIAFALNIPKSELLQFWAMDIVINKFLDMGTFYLVATPRPYQPRKIGEVWVKGKILRAKRKA